MIPQEQSRLLGLAVGEIARSPERATAGALCVIAAALLRLAYPSVPEMRPGLWEKAKRTKANSNGAPRKDST